MAYTESTPVTVHTHQGAASVVSGEGTINEKVTSLAGDQFGDNILASAVLTDGTDVIVTASTQIGPYSGSSYLYSQIDTTSLTLVDNGAVTTNTLSFSGGNDLQGAEPSAVRVQVVPLSGGGFVVGETTVNQNNADVPVNQNLYFEIFNSSGAVTTSWTQVNASGSDAQYNDDFKIVATSNGGFLVNWATNDEVNGYFQRFDANGSSLDSSQNYYNQTTAGPVFSAGSTAAVDLNGNVAIALPTTTDVYTPNSLEIFNSSDVSILNESFQTAEAGLVPTVTNPGHAGVNPVENDDVSPQFVALPGGGFAVQVGIPTGPWNTQNGYPGFDMYMQRISISGSSVTFDTPVLIETLTGNAADNLTPQVLSNGDILLDVHGTYEVLPSSELPTSNTGMASSTPATLTPLFAGGVSPSGTTPFALTPDNNGGALAVLQSGQDTKYYGVLDSNVYAATFDPPCYRTGTRILTHRGEVVVEGLRVGDLAVTASGGLRPVVWLGHRALDCRRHRDPRAVWPVRVAAGAFGDAQPSRDLWLSPGHCVAVDGVLIPIRFLANGHTIAEVETATVEYWHVELDEHDILLAEGLPAESYLDCGNRNGFANGGAFIEAHPDFEPKDWRETCLPLVKGGLEVAKAKARLLARVFEEGHEVTREAGAHILADGRRIEPIRLGDKRLAFALPAGCGSVVLKSNTFIPAHTRAESFDERELGLCVARLQIDGDEVGLEDARLSALGWYGPEHEGHQFARRWTRGEALLPAGARLVLISLAGLGYYWREPVEAKSARTA